MGLTSSDSFMPKLKDFLSTIVVGEEAEIFQKWFIDTEPSLLLY